MLRYLDYIIYSSIILLPFSISIASAPMSIFMGLLIFSFFTKKILKKEKMFIKTAINKPLLFLFIITCLSAVSSIDIKDTIKGGILRLLQYIFIFFAMVEDVKDKTHIHRIIISMICGIILASTDGIWQVLSGKDFIRGYSPVINIGLARATASFKDANTLGIYLSAVAPLIFGLTLYPHTFSKGVGVYYFKGKKRLWLGLVSIIALSAIALTYSRPSLLAIFSALFLFGLIKKDKVLLGILIIAMLVFPFLLPKSVKDFAKQVDFNPLRFMCNDDRIATYCNSLNMIRHHPIIGVGANTFMKNYKTYKESPEYRSVVTSDYMYAHNNFLHMAAEIGLVGLGIFIWLLYKLLKLCLSIYRLLDDRFLKTVSLSLFVCLIAFLANGLTESSLYYSRVAVIFWYMSGLSLGLNKFVHAKNT